MQPCNAAFAMSLQALRTEACQSISAWTCPALPTSLSCLVQLGQHFLQLSRRPRLIWFSFAFPWYDHSFIQPEVVSSYSVCNEVFMTVTQ